MSRTVTEYCGRCGAHWSQDWEEPVECPYCSDESAGDAEDFDPPDIDDMLDYDDRTECEYRDSPF